MSKSTRRPVMISLRRGRCNVCKAWGPPGENCLYPGCQGVYLAVHEEPKPRVYLARLKGPQR